MKETFRYFLFSKKKVELQKTALADRLNLSLTPSWDRLQRLEEEGIIESYGAKLSSSFLKNFHLVITEVELESHKEGEFARFEEAIMGFDEVLSCWSVGGGLDYILKSPRQRCFRLSRFFKKSLEGRYWTQTLL